MCAADSELIKIYISTEILYFLYILFSAFACMYSLIIFHLPSFGRVYIQKLEKERERKTKKNKKMEKIHGMKKTSKIYIRYKAISICITYCKRRAFIDFVFVSHFDFEKDLLKYCLVFLPYRHRCIHVYIIIHQSFIVSLTWRVLFFF